MKRILALLINLCVVVSVVPSVCFGHGMTISNVEDFLWFARQVECGNTFCGETIRITDDIDLRGQEIRPIGTKNVPFCGNLHGDGHYIFLNLQRPSSQNVGLFGFAKFASFNNLGVGGVVVGDSGVGGFVGTCEYTDFYQCLNFVNVGGVNNVGGFVGRGKYCTFNKCKNKGNINGTILGCLVGMNSNIGLFVGNKGRGCEFIFQN